MHKRWSTVWQGQRYLLVGLMAALVTLVVLPLLAIPVLARACAEGHRQRAGKLFGLRVEPRRLAPRGIGGRWARARTDPAGRRDLVWLGVHLALGGAFGVAALWCVGNLLLGVAATVGWWAFPVEDPVRLLRVVPVTGWAAALTVGPLHILVLSALTWWVVPLLARTHARCCLAVLAPPAAERLAQRVEVLAHTRAEALDAHGTELRRIERDLHDGTQARLAAIAVRLGVARESPDDPALLARLLGEAHEHTEEAMAELRAVIRAIYPPILADRGLDGAVSALIATCPVPVTAPIEPVGRLPAAVEAAAYFVISEALANVAKHSLATRVTARLTHTGDRLAIQVSDDGVGGAGHGRGSGLDGIRRRVAAFDGAFSLSSPAGGPTTLRAELPCGS